MSKIFGANWQTTLWGGLQSLIAGIVAGSITFPKDWSDFKQVLPFILVCVATLFGLKFAADAKYKNTTGGTQQQTVDGNLAAAGTQTLVDETIKSSIKSGEAVTPEQHRAATS